MSLPLLGVFQIQTWQKIPLCTELSCCWPNAVFLVTDNSLMETDVSGRASVYRERGLRFIRAIIKDKRASGVAGKRLTLWIQLRLPKTCAF